MIRVRDAVLDVFLSMRFLDLDPEAMREPSPPGLTVLGDRGENLSGVLQATCEDPVRKAQLLAWVRALTPMDVTDFRFVHDFQDRVLVHFVESSRRVTSAISASDGTLRFLAIAAALLSPDSGRLYVFEELDNGLHPTRLHLLVKLIAQTLPDQQVQVVATTHNPYLLGYLDPQARGDAMLVWRPEGQEDSRLKRIVDLPGARKVLETQDLGWLHATGWLEDAAHFAEPDDEGNGVVVAGRTRPP